MTARRASDAIDVFGDARPDLPTGVLSTARRLWHLRWPAAAICHHAKLIYFPVPKAGNTMLLSALTEIERQTGLAPRFSDPRTGEPSHLEWVRPVGRAAWARVFGFNRGYTTFAVVRNPWARLVSCYLDKVRGELDEQAPGRSEVYDGLARYNLVGRVFWPEMTFEQFARRVARIPDFAADPHFRSQWRRFVTPRGDFLADCLIPLEWPDQIGALLSARAGREVEIPRVRATSEHDWRAFYDDELAALVRRRYGRDYSMLGYGPGWWDDPSDRRTG